MVLNPCAESMITAGMEHINFIDPALTWKTVSKGRRTSRRSRRPVSKFLKLDKDQEKKNSKRPSGTDSDKSDLSLQEQGFGNMKHMPIKKRRFFLQSSPTPHSPNHEVSQELDSGPCTLDPQTCSNENTEQDVSGACFSKPVLNKCGVVENTASSFSEVRVSSDDFSGIAILATVAACSNKIDSTLGDIEKSEMRDLPKRKYNESFASMTDMKDSIDMPGSSGCLGMTTGQLMVDGCVADFPSNSIQNDCLKNVTEISEFSRVETNESLLSAINQKVSIECRGSSSDLTHKPIKIADKAAEISGTPKKSRLLWDLNILMDEWGHPIDDTFDNSCMESMAVASSSAMIFQKPENVYPSTLTSPERPLAIESGDQSNSNSESLEYKTSLDANESKSLDALSVSTNSEVPMVELRDSDDSNCLITMEVFVAPLATIVSEKAMNTLNAKEIEENSSTPDASRFDNLMEVVTNVTEALMQVNPTVNNANVANVEPGYDSILEDGQLRESVRHCWEDNDGDDAEIEQVDYDSDNEDIQLSGEVLPEECVKLNHHLEKCGPSLDNIVDEKCYGQYQNCLLTVDAEVAENVKLESPMLKACYGTQLRVEGRIEGDSRDSERSELETDRSGNEYDHNTLRNCRGNSSIGKEIQLSDSSANCISRDQVPLKQTDRFVSRSRNADLKCVAPDSLPKEGWESIGKVSEDNTPTSVYGPRIISISRSVNNPIRESPGERNNVCGRGTVKEGEFTLDSKPRNQYDRSLNGRNRGFGEGYKRPVMYEGGKANGPMVDHFENRIDSHFPQTHRKFRSRSRSRSPDFRADARMGRARSPYQPPGLIRERRSPVKSFSQRQRFDTMGSLARVRSDDCTRPMMRPARFKDTTTSRDPDCKENYHYRKKPFVMHGNRRSRSRSRSYSPDSRMGAVSGPYQSRGGHVRERRSPVRVFQPGHKYDNGDHPTLRTGGFKSFNDTSYPARGNDYNNGGDEYRRNPRNIFERIHPGRQYDEQDNLVGRNSRGNENYARGGGRFGRGGGRGGDRRQGEFRREERGYMRNNNNSDRMFSSGPKHIEGGMREHLLPSGVRP